MRIMSSNTVKYPKPIVGNIPASWQFAVSATWDQPFSKSFAELAQGTTLMKGFNAVPGLNGVSKAFDQKASSLVGNITGMGTLSKWLTMSVWVSGSGMNLTIPMVFRAFDDPVLDVNDKIVQLMMMCAPGSTSTLGTLIAPGPTIASIAAKKAGADLSNTALSGEIITVTLGNFITLPSVIIDSVDVNCDNMYDANGQPISATVNVSIQTPMVLTKQDIVQLFNKNSFKQVGFDIESLINGG